MTTLGQCQCVFLYHDRTVSSFLPQRYSSIESQYEVGRNWKNTCGRCEKMSAWKGNKRGEGVVRRDFIPFSRWLEKTKPFDPQQLFLSGLLKPEKECYESNSHLPSLARAYYTTSKKLFFHRWAISTGRPLLICYCSQSKSTAGELRDGLSAICTTWHIILPLKGPPDTHKKYTGDLYTRTPFDWLSLFFKWHKHDATSW